MIGTPELIVIFIAVLILFGPTKMPELARALGKSMGEFKKAQIEAENQINHKEDAQAKSEDKIVKLATDLGIDTAGKNTEQLLVEIKAKMPPADPGKISPADPGKISPANPGEV